MLRASLGLLTGQFAVFSFQAVPDYLFFVLFVALFIACYRLWRLRLMLTAVLVGALIASVSIAQHRQSQWPVELRSTDVTITGVIDDIPTRSDSMLRFYLSDVQTSAVATPRRVRLTWYRPAGAEAAEKIFPRAGERWQFTARLKSPAGLGNPGSFNVQRHSFITRVDATGYVRDKPPAKRLAVAPVYSVNKVRQALSEKIASLSSGPEGSLVLGLALGISAAITDPQWQVLRNTGTVHLLAISGLHIGLIAAFGYLWAACFWLMSAWVQARCSRQAFAVPIGFLCAASYALLAGFSLPTQRALIMLCVVGVGLLTRRASVASFALCVAAVLIAVLDPTAIMSIGFAMSFVAVALLIYLGQGRQQQGKKWQKAVRLQWQLSLLMLPLSAWFFDSGSLISPLSNLIAIPFVGFLVVPLCLLTVVLAAASPVLASITLRLAETLLEWLMSALASLGSLPGSHIALPVSSLPIVLTALLAVAALVAPIGLRLRRWSLLLLLPLVWYWYELPTVKQLEVHVLDVGQGLSVAVFTRHHTLVFDTGGRFGDSTMMERAVMPFLATRRRKTIDTVVISHADEDHSAGLDYLLETQQQLDVYASDKNAGKPCNAGHSWQWDGVWFAFVHPDEHDQGSRNNRSCVLLISYGEARFLLTGDIEKQAEATLLKRGFELPLTAMTAAHHGSNTSSSLAFLQAMQPEHVVVPAGLGNRYGHPNADVIARFKSIGSQVWLTAEHGAISFLIDRAGVLQQVSSYRHDQLRTNDH